jgi:hypothetical protein
VNALKFLTKNTLYDSHQPTPTDKKVGRGVCQQHSSLNIRRTLYRDAHLFYFRQRMREESIGEPSQILQRLDRSSGFAHRFSNGPSFVAILILCQEVVIECARKLMGSVVIDFPEGADEGGRSALWEIDFVIGCGEELFGPTTNPSEGYDPLAGLARV